MDSQAEEGEVGDKQVIEKAPGPVDSDAQEPQETPVNNAALENMDGDLTTIENDFDDSLLNENDTPKDGENKDEDIDEDKLLNDGGEATENAAGTGEVAENDNLLDEPVENEVALKEGEENKHEDVEQNEVKEGEEEVQDDDALLDEVDAETGQDKGNLCFSFLNK